MKLVGYFEKVALRAHSLTKLEISQLASVSLLGSKEVARRIIPILNDSRTKIENILIIILLDKVYCLKVSGYNPWFILITR